jgi:hypothetical protein
MRVWMRARRRLCVAAFTAMAANAGGAETAGLPDRFLAWQNNHSVYPQALAECDASRSLAAEWDQNLQRLATAIARSGGAVPPGVFAEFKGTMGTGLQDGQPCKGRPLAGTIAMGYWPERVVTPVPGGRPKLKSAHGEHHILTMWLNTFTGVNAERVPEFLRGAAGWSGVGLVDSSSTFQGLPVLNGSVLVITPPGRPPAYVPMPLEQALKLWLPAQEQAVRDAKAFLEQYPSGQRDEMRKRTVDPQQAALARARDLQRQGGALLKAPAYLKLDRDTALYELATQGGADTSAIVMPNPAYYDPRLPRSAVQLIMLAVDGLKLDEPAARNGDAFDSTYLTRQFVEQVDWKLIGRSELR